jgi:hypothetical protein
MISRMFYESVSLCDARAHNEHVSTLNVDTQSYYKYLSLKHLNALLFDKRAPLRVDSTFYSSVIMSACQDVGILFPVQLRNSQRT